MQMSLNWLNHVEAPCIRRKYVISKTMCLAEDKHDQQVKEIEHGDAIYIYIYIYTPIYTLYIIKGSLGGETSVLRTFRMSGKELVKERLSEGKS